MEEMAVAVITMVMETALRAGWDLLAAAVSCVVFFVLRLSDGMGAFTIYTGFDEAKPAPGRTTSRYGLEAVLGGR